MSKVLRSIEEAVKLIGVKSGMTLSFHHHLRNGDYVLNAVMAEVAKAGIRDIKINASSLFDVHEPLLDHIRNGVVTELETAYMGAKIGAAISSGILAKPVTFRTHGSRGSTIADGSSPVDVAFIAAPTSDKFGNCTGKIGKSACGSLGYAFSDAQYAKRVVVITDNLVETELENPSIKGDRVDYVVELESIGNVAGIVSGTTRITRDPVGLVMASYAARIIEASSLLKDGMSFQTGAGGASLAAAKYLKDIMLEKKIRGSFALGGITGYLVDMQKEGCFDKLYDVQCFDLDAVESIRTNPCHEEISAIQYASPDNIDAKVNKLDVVILGATEVDTDFNVNVHTDSNGKIMGGSGGHSDTAQGAKLSMIVAPLLRSRLSIVSDRVTCISTPGDTVDVLVTQHGIAVNPKRAELKQRLIDARLPIVDIHELKDKAQKLAGIPAPIPVGDKVVANVVYRDGRIIDTIKNI
ncbi:MAG: citrate lyase subunit alpha [Clostridia bacterium]|nr:citrate lyase subunit alpha [Clostridia bacterium]